MAGDLYEGGVGKGALSGDVHLILHYPITALSFCEPREQANAIPL
jgi:hypothetical protein